MCCCPNQKGVKIAGLVLVTLLLLGASFAIVYSGFNYNLANANLSAFSWNNVSIVTLSGMGYIIFTSFIGIFAFCSANICLTIIFCILIIISIIVSIILSLFGIIATTQNSFIDTIGCNTEYTDFRKLFNSIDNYLFEVDMQLCSKECPCYIPNPDSYLNNTATAKEYNKWTKTDENSGVISYAQCSDKVKNDVQTNYNSYDNSSFYKLNQTDFIQFYKTVETNFNCTGLCKSSYINRDDNTQNIMAKYLFSDLSMGPPERYGCLPHILNYFAALLKTLGYTLLAVTVFQIVAFILACSLCYIPKNIGDEKYIAQDNLGIKRQ